MSRSVNSLHVLLLRKVGQKSTHLEDSLNTVTVAPQEKLRLVLYLILSRVVNYLELISGDRN